MGLNWLRLKKPNLLHFNYKLEYYVYYKRNKKVEQPWVVETFVKLTNTHK